MADFEKGPLNKFTPCNFDSTSEVVRAIAEVHTELVLIHPFREGNGRVARLLAILMAMQGGLPPLDFGGIQGEKATGVFLCSTCWYGARLQAYGEDFYFRCAPDAPSLREEEALEDNFLCPAILVTVKWTPSNAVELDADVINISSRTLAFFKYALVFIKGLVFIILLYHKDFRTVSLRPVKNFVFLNFVSDRYFEKFGDRNRAKAQSSSHQTTLL